MLPTESTMILFSFISILTPSFWKQLTVDKQSHLKEDSNNAFSRARDENTLSDESEIIASTDNCVMVILPAFALSS